MQSPRVQVRWIDPSTCDASVHAAAWLADDERAQAARLPPHAAPSWVLAHALLRRMIAGAAGVEPAALRFGRDAHGRPFVAAPSVACDIAFSLTHTRRLAACAIAPDVRMGIDAESLDETHPHAARLAERFFLPDEAQVIALQPEGAVRDQAFLDLWTLKEAWGKARGTGLLHTCRELVFTVGPEGRVMARRVAPQAPDPSGFAFQLGRPTEMSVLALAIEAPDPVVSCLNGEPLLIIDPA